MADPVQLTELEHDALTELVNIGVGRAAASLRGMVGDQVLLSVPSVEIVSRMAAVTLIRERESEELVAVRQNFDGAFSGRAMLIFPQANSLELVKAVTGDELDHAEMRALELEALAETGNVVLNGCLATMANLLRRPLTMSLPEVVRGDGRLFFEIEQTTTDDAIVLFLYINFTISGRDIRGYIAMLMDVPSLSALKVLIGEFIASVMAADDLGELS
ncbi:chemotaxis protein CheC [Phenylobacterium sp. LjRoot164]|uniref:chemotaxis protein CheX n=1 Tax=unclassified Phenylobacterium TaxID=2640670 RepID=UPI003ECCC93D